MSRVRQNPAGATYLITRRTILRHGLLRPDEQMKQILLYVLAVAVQRHGLELHALCAMSTHVHLVVTDVYGVLPAFLHMFHRTVANCTKVLRGWDSAVWDKAQTSVVRLETGAAVVEKIAYVLANPVAAGLVRRADQWPGAKVTVSELGRATLRARRPTVYLNPKNPRWVEEGAVAVALPPCVPPESADAFREQVAAELDRLEAEAHARMAEEERCFLGAQGATKVDPSTRATTPEPVIDRNPTFAVGREQGDAWFRAAEVERAFRTAYRAALERWRAGVRDVVFPAGTWAMRVFHRAAVASMGVVVGAESYGGGSKEGDAAPSTRPGERQ